MARMTSSSAVLRELTIQSRSRNQPNTSGALARPGDGGPELDGRPSPHRVCPSGRTLSARLNLAGARL